MRKGYWIIGIFALWCVVCALWYMFTIKRLPNNQEIAIIPAPTTMAIAEILIMITIAFFIGFALAWMMRNEPLEEAKDQLRNASYEIRELTTTVTVQKDNIQTWEGRLYQSDEKAINALTAGEQLTLKVAELTATEEQLRKKNKELEAKAKQLEAEHDSSKFRIKLLESELESKNQTVSKVAELVENVDTTPKVEHRDWSDHPFVRPLEGDSDDRDDLTEIKGIGPAFQKKLYSLDLYTYRQISELDGEAVERLAEVIEVFPDRIHRDNWIGQATRLYNKKIGREI